MNQTVTTDAVTNHIATDPAPGRAPLTGNVSVMLVEDHALVRAAVRQALEAPDMRMVAAVETAEEALIVAPDVRPDVLLVDIDLPGMDGVGLVRELAPRLPATRILMLTVSSAERDLLAAIRAGAAGYLTKDLSPIALQRAVRSACSGELAVSRTLAARLVRGLLNSPRAGHVAPGDPGLGQLSHREREVLELLARGLTDREIARALTISSRTVETHVSRIIHKLRVRNRSDAAQRYRETV